MAQRPSSTAQAAIMPRLTAPLSKLRKQWLSSVGDLDPQAALAVLRQRLESETDGAVRLANMAAQSWIIRQRLIGLQTMLHGAPNAIARETASNDAVSITDETPPADQPEAPETVEPAAQVGGPGWTKLRILTETEVHGMRFFEGSTIEVREEDARKLIEAKSAEPVEPIAEAAPAKPARAPRKAAPKK
jgi:hypothetical protein